MVTPPKPQFIRIYVNTTPSPHDPPQAVDFYLALGVAMVAWGRLEGHFVACLLMVIPIADDKLIGKKLPMRWEKRSKIWRDAFGRIPPLKPHESEAVAFLNRLDELADFRNFLAHALWEFFSPPPVVAVGAVKIKAKADSPHGINADRKTVSMEDLTQFAAEANHLNIELLKLSSALSAMIAPPPLDVDIL